MTHRGLQILPFVCNQMYVNSIMRAFLKNMSHLAFGPKGDGAGRAKNRRRDLGYGILFLPSLIRLGLQSWTTVWNQPLLGIYVGLLHYINEFQYFHLMLVIFFSAQHLSFHVCLHQLADETAAPGPTCAQDAARCTAWIAVCSDSEANKSSNSRKLKSAAILYLVPSCSTLFSLFLLAPYI